MERQVEYTSSGAKLTLEKFKNVDLEQRAQEMSMDKAKVLLHDG